MGLLPDPAALIKAHPNALLAIGRADLLSLFADEVVRALAVRDGAAVQVVSMDVAGKGPKDLRGALPPSLFPAPRCLRVTGARALRGPDGRKTGGEGKEKDEGDIPMVAATVAGLGPQDFLLMLAEPPDKAPWKLEHPLARAGIPGLGVVPLKAPDDRTLLGWLGERCRAARVEADPKLLRLLVESSSGDVLVLTGEVEKLSLAFGGGKADLASAAPLVTQVPSDDVFALTSALIAGRRDRIIAILADLATAGEQPIYLVALVAAQVRTLLTARHALDAGTAPGEVIESLRGPQHVRRALVDAARRLSYETLVEAFARLVAADLAMKSSPHSPQTILETTLFSLFSPPPMGYSYLATLEEGDAT